MGVSVSISLVEVIEATNSEVTLTLLEPTTDDENVMVVLVSKTVLYVGIIFSVCEAARREVSLISAAELDEDTSSEVTVGSDKLLEVTMVEENEVVETDKRGETVTVMTIGVDASVGGVLGGITACSEEIGFVGTSVIIAA